AAAAVGFVVLACFAAAAHTLIDDGGADDERLTREWLSRAREVAPVVVRADFVVNARARGVDDKKVAQTAGELADIAAARVDVEIAHWRKDKKGRAASAAAFQERLKRLDDDTARVVAALPVDLARNARAEVRSLTAVPAGFVAPGHAPAIADARVFAEAKERAAVDLSAAVADACGGK